MPEPLDECSRCAGTGLTWTQFYNQLILTDCPCTRYAEVDLRQTADGEADR